MNNFTFNKKLIRFVVFSAAFCLSFAFGGAQVSAQAKGKKPVAKQTPVKKAASIPVGDLPKVTQVDAAALLNLLKRDGENAKPLLVNFWATWCGPCVEEFPDLVKISNDYQGKIDVMTVSLDDLAEINTSVPQFLAKVKATMPSYLLKTTDENAAIESISKDWQGGLPFTILYDGKGATVYSKQAKFVPDVLRRQIDESLTKQNQPSAFERGKDDARKDIADGKLIYKVNYNKPFKINYIGGFRDSLFSAEKTYGIDILSIGSFFDPQTLLYLEGYNSVSELEVKNRFGENVLTKLKRNFRINQPPNIIELALTKK